ncbi:prolipoprotein diacylglyceryl transferase [Runella sp.]|uniref:prolipoprotein diacylglyceryl transferase n=1 Tax=Runella sp. TaxID=1960881 RepID=UPI003D099ABE
MLNYIVWDIAPDLITIDLFGASLPIQWYSLLFASSFLIGQMILTYFFRTDSIEVTQIESLLLYMVIATVIGARLGHYLFYEWELLFSDPQEWLLSMIHIPFRGLASHGATLAILIALYLYSRKRDNPPFLWLADRIVIAAALGGALIRLGNLFNSEIYGTPTNLPWGFVFVRETDISLLPLVPRHPTQLYEAFFCLFLFALTFYLWKQKRHILPTGIITGIFMILLFSFRFMVEFLKTPQEGFENGMLLNMGQWLSLPVILTGFFILFYAAKIQPNYTVNQANTAN